MATESGSRIGDGRLDKGKVSSGEIRESTGKSGIRLTIYPQFHQSCVNIEGFGNGFRAAITEVII